MLAKLSDFPLYGVEKKKVAFPSQQKKNLCH